MLRWPRSKPPTPGNRPPPEAAGLMRHRGPSPRRLPPFHLFANILGGARKASGGLESPPPTPGRGATRGRCDRTDRRPRAAWGVRVIQAQRQDPSGPVRLPPFRPSPRRRPLLPSVPGHPGRALRPPARPPAATLRPTLPTGGPAPSPPEPVRHGRKGGERRGGPAMAGRSRVCPSRPGRCVTDSALGAPGSGTARSGEADSGRAPGGGTRTGGTRIERAGATAGRRRRAADAPPPRRRGPAGSPG